MAEMVLARSRWKRNQEPGLSTEMPTSSCATMLSMRAIFSKIPSPPIRRTTTVTRLAVPYIFREFITRIRARLSFSGRRNGVETACPARYSTLLYRRWLREAVPVQRPDAVEPLATLANYVRDLIAL